MSTPANPSGSSRLVSTFADDPEMGELIELFLSALPDRVASLSAAWEGQDLVALGRLSHQLKGSASGYGFPAIGDAAGVLESTLRSREQGDTTAVEAVKEGLESLVRLCERACTADE